MLHQKDILVAGGGVAGLMAAMSFASIGYDVICVDPSPPIVEQDDTRADLRSTAFLMPAVEMMRQIGLWDRLAPHAAELRVMRLCDAGGVENEIREQVDFTATEIGHERFGWNIPNRALRQTMIAHAETFPTLDLRMGRAVRDLLPRTGAARVTLIRELLDIPVRTTRYGQKGIVFAVRHALPHNGVSTELHRTGGPFTLVPLPDQDGVHRSAVVWMDTGPNIAELMKLDDAPFSAAATERSCGILGPLQIEGARGCWPIISQQASALTGPRTALIAEAAHVMPPIGAQGLNISLADIRALLDAAGRHGLGSEAMLDDYDRARRHDITLRERGVELLNRAALTEVQPLRDLRRAGLHLIGTLGPVRAAALRRGMGLA